MSDKPIDSVPLEKPKKEPRKFAPTKQVIFSKTYSEKITIREFKGINVNGATVIEAFAQAEQLDVSQMAAEYLIKQLDLPLIGDVVSDAFPPLTVIRDGIPSHSGRIFGNKDVVVFISDYQFAPEIANIFVQALFDFAQRHQSSIVITMKAIDMKTEKMDVKDFTQDAQPKTKEDLIKMITKSKEKRGDEKVYFFTNNEDFANKMIKYGNHPLQETAVSGISGGIIAESAFTIIPVACLFSPIQELYKFIPVDAKAAVALLKCISDILDGKINVMEASKEASNIEDQMIKVLETLHAQSPLTRKGDQTGNMWI